MRFGLLGPLEVQGDGPGDTLITVSAAMQRTVLASLLLQANLTVSADALIDVLWDGKPPTSARATLLNYVARLRRTLGTDLGARVRTSAAGYLIKIDDESELDCLLAQSLERRSAAAARAEDWPGVTILTRRAVDLWRGRPLEDVPAARLHREHVPALAALRLRLHEQNVDAALHQGQYEQAATDLSELIREHPLREHHYERLLVALYCSGRRAQALAAYQDARAILRDELGVDPAPRLQLLHRQILDSAPAARLLSALTAADKPPGTTAGAATTSTPSRSDAVVPRQLPAAVRYFTGRSGELRTLTGLTDHAVADFAAIALITGTPGVGKTALAVHWGHRVAERFPDGQLYVNLRGFDPAGQPLGPEHAVRGFLDALGVAGSRIPATLEAQGGLYRSLVADRRVLVILDNAHDAEQVRPLLPGSPTCLAVVTSRRELTSLVAIEGAHLLKLDLLPKDEARDLLSARLGSRRTDLERGAVDEIIDGCARLPLALAVAAARASTRPGHPLSAIARELHGDRGGLRALDGGDAASDVRAVFSWSYRQLDPATARLFRLLGLHPGPDISPAAAASLAAVPMPRALEVLTELNNAHLITECAAGRYAFHDLLRAYAAELAGAHDTAADRAAATRRTLDHYLHTAHNADKLLQPARQPIELMPAEPAATPVVFAEPAEAMRWYEVEHPVLLAAAAQAAANGLDLHAWQIPWAMTTYLDRAGLWRDQVESLTGALAAVRRLGDRPGQIRTHIDLGQMLNRLTEHDQALAEFQAALDLSVESADRHGQGRARYNLAVVYECQGRHKDALEQNLHALEINRETGHPIGLPVVLNAVGWNYAKLGEYDKTLAYSAESLALLRDTGARSNEADAWDSLGFAHHHLGDLPQALSCYRQAQAIFSELGERYHLARTLMHLGDVHLTVGEPGTARAHWTESLAILTDLAHPAAQQVRYRLRPGAPLDDTIPS